MGRDDAFDEGTTGTIIVCTGSVHLLRMVYLGRWGWPGNEIERRSAPVPLVVEYELLRGSPSLSG